MRMPIYRPFSPPAGHMTINRTVRVRGWGEGWEVTSEVRSPFCWFYFTFVYLFINYFYLFIFLLTERSEKS